MTEHALEVTQENFATTVIERSTELPVLVDFWAPWCAPCRSLTPILERLAEEYAGKFLLATVNTDNNDALAQEYAIRTIPAVKLFRHGQVVDEFVGVYPHAKVRELLDKHIERPSDRLLQEAARANTDGQTELALATLRQARTDDPGNMRIYIPLASALMQHGDLTEAERVLRSLPVSRQQDDDIVRLQTRISYLQLAASMPALASLQQTVATAPANSSASYQLGIRQLAAEDYDAALETLLSLVRQDRRFQDEAGRKALLDLFVLVGPDDPRVPHYRGLLSQALH
jgi:putative thioredoxin